MWLWPGVGYNLVMRNNIRLCYRHDGDTLPGHFKLSEFEGESGLAVIDDGLIQSLESVRADLCECVGEDVQIIITSGTRTEADNVRLAARLGWIDEGGVVARNSRHLTKYGGIAADLYARYKGTSGWRIVVSDVVAISCRHHFNYVKSDYEDGHIHADNRT